MLDRVAHVDHSLNPCGVGMKSLYKLILRSERRLRPCPHLLILVIEVYAMERLEKSSNVPKRKLSLI